MKQNEKIIAESRKFLAEIRRRRSIRAFCKRKIPIEAVENCIAAAGNAPSGANMQPWTFVLVKDSSVKKRIRIAAEKVEKEFYQNIIPDNWRKRLKPLGTNFRKKFLTEAPYLICIFAQTYGLNGKRKVKHYYVNESVGLATGILITALNHLGIGMLTYTPAPMLFLNNILKRPENERPFLILAIGYPSKNYKPPKLRKKKPEDIIIKI